MLSWVSSSLNHQHSSSPTQASLTKLSPALEEGNWNSPPSWIPPCHTQHFGVGRRVLEPLRSALVPGPTRAHLRRCFPPTSPIARGHLGDRASNCLHPTASPWSWASREASLAQKVGGGVGMQNTLRFVVLSGCLCEEGLTGGATCTRKEYNPHSQALRMRGRAGIGGTRGGSREQSTPIAGKRPDAPGSGGS